MKVLSFLVICATCGYAISEDFSTTPPTFDQGTNFFDILEAWKVAEELPIIELHGGELPGAECSDGTLANDDNPTTANHNDLRQPYSHFDVYLPGTSSSSSFTRSDYSDLDGSTSSSSVGLNADCLELLEGLEKLPVLELHEGDLPETERSDRTSANDGISTTANDGNLQETYSCFDVYLPGTSSRSSSSSSISQCSSSHSSSGHDASTSSSSGTEFRGAEKPPKGPFLCSLLNKSFRKEIYLEVHQGKHKKEKSDPCSHCDKKLPDKTNLYQDSRRMKGKIPHSCEICGDVSSDASQVKDHAKTHKSERPLSCEICRKSFEYESSWKLHMRSHTKEAPFSCEICGGRFSLKSNLDKHKLLHGNHRPFLCQICGKSFRSKQNLESHKRTHAKDQSNPCSVNVETNEMLPSSTESRGTVGSESASTSQSGTNTSDGPVKCRLCGVWIPRASSLHRHMEIQHPANNGKPTCAQCGKVFVTKWLLKRHEATQTCNGPHKCTICAKVYTRKKDLVNHMVKHTNIREPPQETLQNRAGPSHRQWSITSSRAMLDSLQQDEDCDEETLSRIRPIIEEINKSFHDRYSS